MTPDAKDLCVFAVKRGDITGRFDVRNLKYSQSQSGKKQEKVSLGSLTSEEPCYGTSASAIERTDESQPKYIRITDFDDFGIEDNHKFVTTENYVQKHILEIGDILFARTGGTVGKTYYYDGSIGKSVFAGYCIRFRFDDKKVLPKFIYWYTKTTAFTNWVKGIQRPSGQPNINKEEYKSFEIILPDYETQGKLCSEMDNAEIERKQKLYHANELLHQNPIYLIDRLGLTFDFSATQKITYATTVANIEGRIDADYYSPKFSHFRKQIEALPYRTVSVNDISEKIVSGFAAGKQDQADNLPEDQRVPHLRPFSITPEGELSFETKKYVPKSRLKSEDYCKKNEVIFNNTNSPDLVGKTTVFDSDVLCAAYLDIPDMPKYNYQYTGKKYAEVCAIAKKIAAELKKAGADDYDLLAVDYFMWDEILPLAEKKSPVSPATPEVKKPVTVKDSNSLHDEIKEKLVAIGELLGFDSRSEVKITTGAVVDAVWEAKIGNMGKAIYVFEVQSKGSIDSLILNLKKAQSNAAVQAVVAVADEEQLAKIIQESAGVIDEKSLRTWDSEDVLAVYDALVRAHESINKLALVPESF